MPALPVKPLPNRNREVAKLALTFGPNQALTV
jgi:hypothetical protein